ncbi:MAG: 2,3-bisphosphoglycerate-independent phosphoglycerate mutase [Phycisphaerales bacterium]|nr:2,3-bisphosphoglycerate-independent phosphoglycerate mutase [Phycisphaerales bacterium]
MSEKPAVLIIRDGWGTNPHPEQDAFNAIHLASTPVADRLMADWPHTHIRTSGEAVGLLEGTMGNSEVGHQNIGAGRIVDQEAVRITKVCREKRLRQNEVLPAAIHEAKRARAYVHLMGICSDAGVHGLLEHLFAILDLCKEMDHDRVALHLFTDGRDTGPFTGKAFVERVQAKLDDLGIGRIASVIGRYWAMDRDNRWERVQRAYICMTGQGAREADVPVFANAVDAVQAYYDEPSSDSMRGDEYVTPAMIGSSVQDALSCRVTNNDVVVFYNYRGDRPREIVSAFTFRDFHGHVKPSPDTGEPGFQRGAPLRLRFLTMTSYADFLKDRVEVIFPRPPRMTNIAGEHLARLGRTQFRCAETEKFPHVTFFFNDYADEPFEGEHREIIQSPRVATYDQKPEMSAHEVRDAVLRRLDATDTEDVIVVNFANGDMVGHTGNLEATVRACEVVDECVGAIVDRVLEVGGTAIVTADHGNAEQMWNPETDAPHTAHTTFDVPLILVDPTRRDVTLRSGGCLGDIMPTLLEVMGWPQPDEMTGRSLLE